MKKYKLNPYSDEQKNRWKDSKKIIIFEDEQMLMEFVKDALRGKVRGKKKKKDLAAAIDELASNDTSETTGGTVSLNKNIPSSDK